MSRVPMTSEAERPAISRRAFLRLAAFGAAGITLAACGATQHTNDFTVTATPSAVPSADPLTPVPAPAVLPSQPTVTPASTATLAPAPIVTPTLTPSLMPTPSVTPHPQPALSPVAMPRDLANRCLAAGQQWADQDLQRQFQGRLFADSASGTTILFSAAAQRALAVEAMRSDASGAYISEANFQRHLTARRLLDSAGGTVMPASRQTGETPAAADPSAEELAATFAHSEAFARLSRYWTEQRRASAASPVIVDIQDEQMYAVFLPSVGSARRDGAVLRLSGERAVDAALPPAPRSTPAVGRTVASEYRWDELRSRICAVDSYGTSAVYGLAENRWRATPLDEDMPPSFGEPLRQTLRQSGRALAMVRPDGSINSNAVELVPNSAGVAVALLLLGGPAGSLYGIDPAQAYLAWVRDAIATLNRVDPQILDVMAGFGMQCIACDIPPTDFINEREKSWAATFNVELGVIEVNQKAADTVKGCSNVLTTLLLEARNIAFRRGRVAKLDPNQGVDKGMYVRAWADANRQRLEPAFYNQIVDRANFTVTWYRQNLP